MRTIRARELIRKERREALGLELSKNKELVKKRAQKDVLDSYKKLVYLQPRLKDINDKVTILLRDTEELVKSLEEPILLIEIADTKELLLCRPSDVKKRGQ